MIVIGDKIVSDDVVQKEFVCNLSACKGVCCVEGEGGAPLEDHELGLIDDVFDEVKPYLTKRGLAEIEKQGRYTQGDDGVFATPLIDGKDCVYLNFDEKGIAKCQIEKAWEDGNVGFRKPVSCHLYPIRVKKHDTFEAVNYSKWEICDPACKLGAELQVPIYKFLKEALTRKYGSEFYDELELAAKFMEKEKND